MGAGLRPRGRARRRERSPDPSRRARRSRARDPFRPVRPCHRDRARARSRSKPDRRGGLFDAGRPGGHRSSRSRPVGIDPPRVGLGRSRRSRPVPGPRRARRAHRADHPGRRPLGPRPRGRGLHDWLAAIRGSAGHGRDGRRGRLPVLAIGPAARLLRGDGRLRLRDRGPATRDRGRLRGGRDPPPSGGPRGRSRGARGRSGPRDRAERPTTTGPGWSSSEPADRPVCAG